MTSPAFPYLLVIFDLDGVLVDSDACHSIAYEETWARLAVRGAPTYAELAGRRTRDVIEEQIARQGIRAELDASVRFKQDRARHHLETALILFPDVPQALPRFARVARLAVGTGASRETARIMLQRLGALARFEAMVAAEDVAFGKPAPDVYLRVLELCGVAAAQTLIVEDSNAGATAALRAGADLALVRSGKLAPEGEPRPHIVGAFADLTALADALGLPR